MFRIATVLTICSTTILAGCPWSSTVRPTTEPGHFYGTHLFVNTCRTQVALFDQKAGLEVMAPLVASVASTAMARLGKAIAKVGEDDVKQTWAYTNLASLESLSGPAAKSTGSDGRFIGIIPNSDNPSQQNSPDSAKSEGNGAETRTGDSQLCVQVVRGTFQFSSNQTGDIFVTRLGDGRLYPASLELVEGKEELFIELLPVSTSNVISFVPLMVRYSGYSMEDDGDEGPRELALYVGYGFPDKDISAGELTGRLITFDPLYPDENGRAQLSYVDPESNRVALLNHTQWLAVPNAEAMKKPVTLGVKVIETRAASSMAKFMAEVYKESEEEIKKSVDAAVADLEILKTSTELKDELIKADEAALSNETAYLSAIGDVYAKETALIELCSNENPTATAIYTARTELYLAKKTANIKAATAGKPLPYPKLKAAEEEVKTDCP